jgi:hypothetical protein
VLSRVDLGHLAAQHALGAVAEPLSALLGDELLANLARLSITIIIQVLLQYMDRNSWITGILQQRHSGEKQAEAPGAACRLLYMQPCEPLHGTVDLKSVAC